MEQLFRRKSVRARILGNPLGPVLQQYIVYLEARGRKPSSVHQYVFALEHFGNWLGERVISHESVDEFMVDHIPRVSLQEAGLVHDSLHPGCTESSARNAGALTTRPRGAGVRGPSVARVRGAPARRDGAR